MKAEAIVEQGYWWYPQYDRQRVPGELTIECGRRPAIILLLNPAEFEDYPMRSIATAHYGPVPLIYGTTSRGPVTMCMQRRRQDGASAQGMLDSDSLPAIELGANRSAFRVTQVPFKVVKVYNQLGKLSAGLTSFSGWGTSGSFDG